jgi:hypothetical protein
MTKDWKSTASGVLSFLVTTLTTISAFLVAGNINDGGTSTSSIHVSTWVIVGVNAALALCRAWIGLITTNADAGAVANALNDHHVAIATVMPAPPPPTIPTAASLAATPKVP